MTESVIDTRFVVQAEFDPDRGGMVDVYCAVEAVWREVNPTLGENRKGRVTDTGAHKIGDGVTAWNDLPWSVGPAMGEHEREMRNRDTRGIVDHWLDRLVDVEGTVHQTLVGDGQDMVVTLLVTGRCPSNLPPQVCESCGNALSGDVVTLKDGTQWHVDCYVDTFKGDQIWRGPSPLTTPLDQMVKILMANGVEPAVDQVRSMRLWLEAGQRRKTMGYCTASGKKHWGAHAQKKSCIGWARVGLDEDVDTEGREPEEWP